MQKKLQTNTAEEILSTVYKPIEYFVDGLLAQELFTLIIIQSVTVVTVKMMIKLPSRKGVLKPHKRLYSVDCGACR